MTDSLPLVCVFFQLPPSQQLFMRIHDIPWLILLPQLDKLSTALETLLATNPSLTAKKTLREARRAMGSKMIPLRDFILSGRRFSRHYLDFVEGVSENRMLSAYVKGAYNEIAQKAAKKTEEAQQALSEFREELERVVVRISSLVGGDANNVSLFITESSLIVSVMVTAIEECKALLQECRESFLNINKQAFDSETFERNPPSDEEFEFVEEKWEMLENLLHEISVDWSLLEGRMEIPHSNDQACDVTPQDALDVLALTGTSENPVDPEASPDVPSPKKAKISFWQRFHQRISSCFSSKPFS